MKLLLDPLPSVAFPFELDALTLSGRPFEQAQLVLTLAGEELMTASLLLDEHGRLTLPALSRLLNSRLTAAPAKLHLSGAVDGAVTILPCRTQMDKGAADFCASHFLTLLSGAKLTTLFNTELLSFYDASGAPTVATIRAQWAVGSAVKETVLTRTTQLHGNIHTFRLRPCEFQAPAAGAQLLAFEVSVGQRSQAYQLAPQGFTAAPTRLTFRNSFGQLETICFFGQKERELEVTRGAASFEGRWRNYSALAYHSYKASMGFLPDGMIFFLEDCAQTLEAYDEQGREVCVTDCDVKLSNSPTETAEASVRWRETGQMMSADLFSHVRTFDETFDTSFQ